MIIIDNLAADIRTNFPESKGYSVEDIQKRIK